MLWFRVGVISVPQARIVPSDRRARENWLPAATATALVRSGGTSSSV